MKIPVNVSDSPLPQLPPRAATSHKGDFGRVLLIGGSRNMSGAIALAGMAALRSGAGRVTLAVPASIQPIVAAQEPSYMTLALPEENGGQIGGGAAERLAEPLAQATAVAVGPGLGRGQAVRDLVSWLDTRATGPLVIDADGLNALAERPDRPERPAGPRILTPHPGEFARLMGDSLMGDSTTPIGDDDARAKSAATLALTDASGQTVVLLKGHRTVVTDGQRYVLNTTGNPGMATGGSGDVLTGLLTALLAQNLTPFDAARLAAHRHGQAGDLAAAELGQISLIAGDLIRFLSRAFQQ